MATLIRHIINVSAENLSLYTIVGALVHVLNLKLLSWVIVGIVMKSASLMDTLYLFTSSSHAVYDKILGLDSIIGWQSCAGTHTHTRTQATPEHEVKPGV